MALKSNGTLAEVLQSASVFLEAHGLDGTLARQYWLLTFDWTLTQCVQVMREPVSESQLLRFEAVLHRVVQHEPIQYILGYADFMGERFIVSPDTLIPREDTAGIIQYATTWLKERPTAHVLDIGTGTGVLAIMIAKHAPQAQVEAVDISERALTVARLNQQHHHTQVQFYQSDLLAQLPPKRYDLIVSNPPYISESEWPLMDCSVRQYEPAIALFAENEGLAIYQRLAVTLPHWLNAGGSIILEIGFKQATAVTALFQQQFPTAAISVAVDLNGLDRYIIVTLPQEEG